MKAGSILLVWLLTTAATAAAATPARHDTAHIRLTVETFLRAQTQGMPGEIVIEAGAVDPRLALPLCGALEPFMTPGSRLVGKLTVGVRCTAPSAWTVYVPATVKVIAQVVVGVRPLAPGEVIGRSDLALQSADLGQLPGGVLTDPAQAVGKTVSASLLTGQPLRRDILRSPPAIIAGQSVKVVSRGPGFEVRTEGKAVSSAAVGQVAQVRVASGQIVSGIARQDATIEVGF
jgi:flagellar basal body P-ring formation protein FlgA